LKTKDEERRNCGGGKPNLSAAKAQHLQKEKEEAGKEARRAAQDSKPKKKGWLKHGRARVLKRANCIRKERQIALRKGVLREGEP